MLSVAPNTLNQFGHIGAGLLAESAPLVDQPRLFQPAIQLAVDNRGAPSSNKRPTPMEMLNGPRKTPTTPSARSRALFFYMECVKPALKPGYRQSPIS